MQRISHYLLLFLLGAALVAPVMLQAAAPAQYSRNLANPDERHEKRYYDHMHKDYHVWNDQENRAYRHWLEERREAYRDFGKLKRREQEEYWTWRHGHPEYDRR
jgi:hypothetical protein